MVAFRFQAFVFCCGLALALSSCPMTYYNDYDSRFAYHEEFHFLTAADRSQSWGSAYSFIVVSDIHIGGDESAREFAKLKDKLNGAAFVVAAGDLTDNGTREELRLFINAAASLGVPCYPVIGNHDIYTARAAPWRELIGSTAYRIDSPGTSLFILDNANAALGYDQLSWFERELKTAPKNTFVFAHENLFTGGPFTVEQVTDLRERAKLMSLLKDRCDALFMGHIHQRIVKEYGGTMYITLENYGSTDATGVFCRVSVSETGISYQFETVF
jgi:3',5'-cyclic AMP phosphodiesterase CpdA